MVNIHLAFSFAREQISSLKETGTSVYSFMYDVYEWDSDKESGLFSLLLHATENKNIRGN